MEWLAWTFRWKDWDKQKQKIIIQPMKKAGSRWTKECKGILATLAYKFLNGFLKIDVHNICWCMFLLCVHSLLHYYYIYFIHIIRVITHHNTVIQGIWMGYIIYQSLVLAQVWGTPFVMLRHSYVYNKIVFIHYLQPPHRSILCLE